MHDNKLLFFGSFFVQLIAEFEMKHKKKLLLTISNGAKMFTPVYKLKLKRDSEMRVCT